MFVTKFNIIGVLFRSTMTRKNNCLCEPLSMLFVFSLINDNIELLVILLLQKRDAIPMRFFTSVQNDEFFNNKQGF